MFLIYVSIYAVVLLVLWAFYAVARMHSMKFKNFSHHVAPVSNFLFIILLILSILGGILLFMTVPQDGNYEISTTAPKEKSQQESTTAPKTLESEIIGEDYY